jgi:hypothetical protein
MVSTQLLHLRGRISPRHPPQDQEDTTAVSKFRDDSDGAPLSDSGTDGLKPMGLLNGKDHMDISHAGGEFGVLFEDPHTPILSRKHLAEFRGAKPLQISPGRIAEPRHQNKPSSRRP